MAELFESVAYGHFVKLAECGSFFSIEDPRGEDQHSILRPLSSCRRREVGPGTFDMLRSELLDDGEGPGLNDDLLVDFAQLGGLPAEPLCFDEEESALAAAQPGDAALRAVLSVRGVWRTGVRCTQTGQTPASVSDGLTRISVHLRLGSVPSRPSTRSAATSQR